MHLPGPIRPVALAAKDAFVDAALALERFVLGHGRAVAINARLFRDPRIERARLLWATIAVVDAIAQGNIPNDGRATFLPRRCRIDHPDRPYGYIVEPWIVRVGRRAAVRTFPTWRERAALRFPTWDNALDMRVAIPVLSAHARMEARSHLRASGSTP